MDALGARRPHHRRWLLLAALLTAAGLLGEPAPTHPVLTGGVAFGQAAADTDLLYVEPLPGLPVSRLVEALHALGFDAAEAAHDGVRVRVTGDVEALGAALAATGLVRSVEPDAVVRAARVPGDPLYEELQRPYLEAVRAPEAWAAVFGEAAAGTEAAAVEDGVGGGRPPVLVAIVDTGLDWNHPDLAGQVFVNDAEQFMSGRDNDGNGCPDDIAGCNFVTLSSADPSCGYVQAPPNWRAMDDEGHGTFVSGVAAAAGDNAAGVAGIAWDARILPVKVLDCTATGRVSDAAAGIRYAAAMGAQVINISFGTPNDSPALREAVAFAQERGAVVVASAGNDGRQGVTFPARYPGVLSVAASGLLVEDGRGGQALDYGATAGFAHFGDPVDFLAPGVGLASTVPAALCESGAWDCLDGPYAVGSGSSYATPMVTGAMALLIAHAPERTPDFLAGLLLAARAPRTGEPGGLLDIAGAVERPIYTGGLPGTARGEAAPAEGSLPSMPHPD